MRRLFRGGVYLRAAFIRLKDDIRAASIQGRRLFEGGIYIQKYGMGTYLLGIYSLLQGYQAEYLRMHNRQLQHAVVT